MDWAELERLHAEALAAASAYELVRREGRTPDDELEAVAEMSAAINDAPTDDLDIEDEVFSPERIRAYEDAQLARGTGCTGSSHGTGRPASWPATRSSSSTASGPSSATSTTPSVVGEPPRAPARGCCSRPR